MTNLYCHDLVDIEHISSIPLDIRYATMNNFTKKKVYPSARCFLRKRVAEQLVKAQQEFKTHNLSLKIYDGYRPKSIQYIFWNLVPNSRYVADPAKGSRHNRGAAVDLTLIDDNGKELDMGTDFDDFTHKSHRGCITISLQAQNNRKLLEDIMTKYGFVGLDTEWWHFDYNTWQEYDLLDIPFAVL